MHTFAMHAEEAGCHGGDLQDMRDDLRHLWRAMTGGRGGGPGHHRRHHGPPPWARGAFGGIPPGERGGPFGRGRKARRGDIRTAALLLIAEQPCNGYQIMQELQERTDGLWRPSPGSVYPALQQLEDEGLIRSEESDGRKLFQITDEGRRHVDERHAGQAAPWEEMKRGYGAGAAGLGGTFKEVAVAFAQVMRAGSETQMKQAGEVLRNARRDLYRILAEGDGGPVEQDARDSGGDRPGGGGDGPRDSGGTASQGGEQDG